MRRISLWFWKISDGLAHRQVEDLGDVLALELDAQGGLVEALALADLAGDEHVGEEVHLHELHAVALAGLAPAALHVEAEAAGLVAESARLGRLREDVADEVEHLGVGGRVGARRPPDGLLVDVDDLVDLLVPDDGLVLAGHVAAAVEQPRQRGVEDAVHERRLPGPGDAGHRHEAAEREGDGDVAEVVLAGADDREPPLGRWATPGRNRDLRPSGEVGAGQRCRVALHVVRRPRRDDAPAVLAGARAEVDEPVGGLHGLLVVLDDDDGVPDVAQPLQGGEELPVVPLVKPDGGLVEDVDDAGELAAHLGREPDALALSAGERGTGPVERQVGEPDVDEEPKAVADLLEEFLGDAGFRPLQCRGRRATRATPGWSCGRGRRCSSTRMRTARLSGRSRSPWQVGQGLSEKKRM